MDNPELIIFDLGRVLVEYDFMMAVRRLKRHSPKTEAQIKKYFSQTPLWDAFERGRLTPGEFFKSIQKDLQLEGLALGAFGPLWNEIFVEKHDTLAVLSRLRGRYRLAMISNVNPMHWDHIAARFSFMRWFDPVIPSFAAGYRKPEPEIFRLALHRAGVSPARALFIDDLPSHIHGAQSVGIRSHLFLNAARLAADLDGIL